MQEYTGFPKYSSWNLDFSREIFTKIRNFHDILRSPVTKFPGILVDKTSENAEIYGFHVFLRVKFEVLPGIFVDPSTGLEKRSLYPRRAPSRIYGFPGPPRRTFWTLKRTPKNLFALNGLYGGKKWPIFGRNFAKNGDKILQKIHKNVDLKKCSYQVVKTEMCRLFFENIFYLFFFRPKICTWWPI